MAQSVCYGNNNSGGSSFFCIMTNGKVNILTLSKQDTSVMKGVAIIAMLCHLVYNCQPEWVSTYPYWLTMLGVLGKVCVAIFLFCSGYGLATQYEKILFKTSDTKAKIYRTLIFIFKRFVKFYSSYWFVFLIFVPITIFFFDRPLSVVYGENVNILKRLFFDLLGVQGFQSYNITWWFNKLIILFYLLFPIFFIAVKKTKWFGLLCSFVLMRYANKLGVANYYDIMLWQFPFLLGIGWVLYQEKVSKWSNWIEKHLGLIIIGVSVLLLLGILQRLYNIVPLGNITGVRVDGLLCLLLALCVALILRRMKYTYMLLSFLGKHSMNIYLIHTFLNYYWEPIHCFLHTNKVCCFMGLNMWILLIACLLISIILEFMKEKLYWNKLTNTVLTVFDYNDEHTLQ